MSERPDYSWLDEQNRPWAQQQDTALLGKVKDARRGVANTERELAYAKGEKQPTARRTTPIMSIHAALNARNKARRRLAKAEQALAAHRRRPGDMDPGPLGIMEALPSLAAQVKAHTRRARTLNVWVHPDVRRRWEEADIRRSQLNGTVRMDVHLYSANDQQVDEVRAAASDCIVRGSAYLMPDALAPFPDGAAALYAELRDAGLDVEDAAIATQDALFG